MGLKPRDRQARIADLIGLEGRVSVDELSERFAVSSETIRRDLGQLAERGAVQKVHGGAKRVRLHAEGTLKERMAEGAEAKRSIARKLADMLEPGDTLFMDTGSTTQFCAEALAQVGTLTVITNSVSIAQIVADNDTGSAVYLLGGRFAAGNGETAGPLVLAQLAGFQADRAVLTVAAIDEDAGVMDADFDEAQIAREMIGRARQTVVVADASKFARRAAFRVCALDEIDILITDQPPEPHIVMAIERAGVDLR